MSEPRSKLIDPGRGEVLRRRRLRQGFSRRGLAARVGVDEKTVFNWERGRPVGHRNLLRLLRVLGWTELDLEEAVARVATTAPAAPGSQPALESEANGRCYREHVAHFLHHLEAILLELGPPGRPPDPL